MKFQNELISKILIPTFIKYGLNEDVLLDINNELKKSNWKICFTFFKKKINGNLFKLIVYLDVDVFTLSCIIESKQGKEELTIFKFMPFTLVVFSYFKRIKVDKEFLIGNQKPLFKVDIEKKEVFLIEENEDLIDERVIYKHAK